jgi:hypothetical protein
MDIYNKLNEVFFAQPDFLKETQWLVNWITSFNNKELPDQFYHSIKNQTELKNKSNEFTMYKNIVKRIKTLTNAFLLIDGGNEYFDKHKHPIFFKNPEFILDNYFYHPENIANLPYSYHEQVYNFFIEIEYFYYRIINHLKDLEFDLHIEKPIYNIGEPTIDKPSSWSDE